MNAPANRPAHGSIRSLVLLCVLLSGAAGLVLEICWIRITSLQFGSSVHATSVVLAVFFLGLGLGGQWFGSLSRRTIRPLRWLALLELGVCVTALASPAGFRFAERLYGFGLTHAGVGSPAAWLMHVLAIALVLLPPTLLMGGALPMACRAVARHDPGVGQVVAGLYSLNTAGAAAGAALTGYMLIPRVGVTHAIQLAAALDLMAALLATVARPAAEVPAPDMPERPSGAAFAFALVMSCLFVTGFVTLGQEVVWTRFLALIVRNTVHTYALTIVVVLSGMLLGSLGMSVAIGRIRNRTGWLAGLLALQGLAALTLMTLPSRMWISLTQPGLAWFALMLAPSVLSGASFPLAVSLLVRSYGGIGAGLGRAMLVNTLGGILGAMVTGFFLLPRAGLDTSIRALTAASLVAAVLAWLSGRPRRVSRHSAFAAAVCIVAFIFVPRIAGTRLPADYLANGGELVELREGLQSNLAVVRRDGILSLEIDRWWQGESRKTHQVMAAHVPLLFHPKPRRVLVVGVGAGQTPSRFLMYPVERLECVDIEPAVFPLIRPHFDSKWMNDPRVRLVTADGRSHITHSRDKWDVISLEVGQMFRPGAAAFYTEEFYRLVRARLATDGIVSQFVPISFLDQASFAGILRTFLEVFPNATLWYNTSELLLIGGGSTPPTIDPDLLARLPSMPSVGPDLRFAYWGGQELQLDRPGVVLGGFLCGPRGLRRLCNGARIDHDDHPALDYATANAEEADMNERPILALIRRELDPLSSVLRRPADAVWMAAAERARLGNLADLAANADLRRIDGPRRAGDYETVLRLVESARAQNPENLDAERLMGETLLLLGRDAEAQGHLRRVIAERPMEAAARRALALSLHRERRFSEAIDLYRAALEIGPDLPDTRNNLGAALAESGFLREAEAEFSRALVLRPGDSDALRNLRMLRNAPQSPTAPNGAAAR